MRLTKLLFSLFALILVSCECPYQDELDRAQQRKTTGDVFHADVLLGTWQCYYPMIIGGMEFKQIKFMLSEVWSSNRLSSCLEARPISLWPSNMTRNGSLRPTTMPTMVIPSGSPEAGVTSPLPLRATCSLNYI